VTQLSDHNQDDVALAGEYALHLLDAGERAAFEARLVDSPALQVLVREWDEDLMSWHDATAEVKPRAQVKAAIEARLFGAAKPKFSLRSLFGPRYAYLAFASVAALAIWVGPMIMNTPTGPQYVAEMASEDGVLIVAAAFDPNSAELSIMRTSGGAASGRSLELWLIADGADAPVSLGVMSETELSTVTVPESLRTLMAGGTLAISDEPFGGSPTGAPTGAVLAAGQITLL
jgi:anti-sigma-K factor RskA